MDAYVAHVNNLVTHYEVFQEPGDELPLAECDFYVLLDALRRNECLQGYIGTCSEFRDRLEALSRLDVTAITSAEYTTIANYAAYYGRCDLIERWAERRSDGPELLNAISKAPWHELKYFIPLLPQLLERGELTAPAAGALLEWPEGRPYLVGYVRHPIFDVTSKSSTIGLWRFLIDAFGAHSVADPQILYRALTHFNSDSELIPLLWSVYPAEERELTLAYKGEIGTIRELFDLRQVRGLPGLPPAPFQNDLFSGNTHIRLTDAECALVAERPDLEEHVGFCQHWRRYDEREPKYLSWMAIGLLSDGDYALLRKLRAEPQPRRAILYCLLAVECNQGLWRSSRAQSLALVRAKCLELLA